MRNNDETIKQNWHIPKRSSVHQTIGALKIIKELRLVGESWNGEARKRFNQALGTWGFTSKKTSLSDTARETLEALLKYLGLVYMSSNGPIEITAAGEALLREIEYHKPLKPRALKETAEAMGDIEPEMIKTQLLKLVISNPIIREYCVGVSISPLRETMRFMLDSEIGYLSREELAMFVFQMTSRDKFEGIKRNILDFRKLEPTKQLENIRYFCKTYIGNKLLGESSAIVKYWVSICKISGWFDKDYIGLKFKSGINLQEITKRILKYERYPIYDFEDNISLWLEYYGDPNVVDMPIDVQFTLLKYSQKLLLIIKKDNKIVSTGQFTEPIVAPLFPSKTYNIEIMDLNDEGKTVFSETYRFCGGKQKLLNFQPKSAVENQTAEEIAAEITDMITSEHGFDYGYFNRLQILEKVLGLGLKIDNPKKMSFHRGGRLEYIVYNLLKRYENNGLIKNVKWYGKIAQHGICNPAPGGQNGNPDITFETNNVHYVLELTTTPGIRAQWNSSEASSVPDHILNFKAKNNIHGKNGYGP